MKQADGEAYIERYGERFRDRETDQEPTRRGAKRARKRKMCCGENKAVLPPGSLRLLLAVYNRVGVYHKQ